MYPTVICDYFMARKDVNDGKERIYENNILYFEKPMSKCGLTEAGSLCQK